MTKSSLNPGQRRTVEIIEALGFGVIERLSIRGGLPCLNQNLASCRRSNWTPSLSGSPTVVVPISR